MVSRGFICFVLTFMWLSVHACNARHFWTLHKRVLIKVEVENSGDGTTLRNNEVVMKENSNVITPVLVEELNMTLQGRRKIISPSSADHVKKPRVTDSSYRVPDKRSDGNGGFPGFHADYSLPTTRTPSHNK